MACPVKIIEDTESKITIFYGGNKNQNVHKQYNKHSYFPN